MSSKKGQGLSLNVIIIAALGLLILVILTVLVIKSAEGPSKANECDSVPGAYCSDSGCESGEATDRFKKGCESGDVCCIPLTRGE